MNRRKTPLGDKFEDKDFPMLPEDWANMADLLGKCPSEQPSGVFLSPLRKFLMGVIIFGVMALAMFLLWQGILMPLQEQKKPIAQHIDKIEKIDNQLFTTENFAQKNELDDKKDSQEKGGAVARLSPSEKVKMPSESANLAAPDARFADAEQVSISKKGFQKSVLPPSILKDSALKSSKLSKSTAKKADFSKNTPPQYATGFSPKLDLKIGDLEENTAVLSNNLLKNEKVVLEEMGNKLTKQTNVETAANSLFEKGKLPAATDDKTAKTATNFIENGVNSTASENVQNADNQTIAEKNRRSISKNIEPLSLRSPKSVASKLQRSKAPLKQVQAQSAQIVIPIKVIAARDKHRLNIGAGKSFFGQFSYNDAWVNRFRAAYTYRVKPFLGISAAAAYSLYANRDFVSAADAEILFYLPNQSRFDVALGAGYGYRTYRFLESIGPESLEDNGLVASANLDYLVAKHWQVGVRLDTKAVNGGWDWGVQLGITRGF